jgi:hypothetical protein
MMVQGKKITTRLVHALRLLRGAYIQNVLAGKCKLDKKALRDFDQTIKDANEQRKSTRG